MFTKFLRPLHLLLVITISLIMPAQGFAAIVPNDPSAGLSADSSTNMQINEVMFQPNEGESGWVELKNSGSSPISLDNYQLTDMDDNWYEIPSALPDVPGGAFVVVRFDGLGSVSDEIDFSDNRATLHSPADLAGIFAADVDQVALYRIGNLPHMVYMPVVVKNYTSFNPPVPEVPTDFAAPAIVDFVAWGGPPAGDDGAAVSAGLWPAGAYLETVQVPGGDGLVRGGSIGVFKTVQSANSTFPDWVIYRPVEVSQGQENPLVAPYFRNPPNGITTDDHQITFGWSIVNGATSYHLEVDDDAGFASPALAVDVSEPFYRPPTPLPDGSFFFRVKPTRAGSPQDNYSASAQFTLTTVITNVHRMASEVLLSVTPKLQHKDTLMLDLDGSTATGQSRWDTAHETDGDAVAGNGTAVRANSLDNMYCTRASISMLVAYHGGKLSQDRIAFQRYGGGPPDGDLGHGRGMWPNQLKNQGNGANIFDWAMNGNAVTSSRGKPTFDQVMQFIDAGRPMLVVENNDVHSVVLDGYFEVATVQFAHRVDPWTATGSWVLYSSWNISEYHAPPAGVTPRSDEDLDGDSTADTVDDSDGDGVSDFDERTRFNLGVNDTDSDDDLVFDKADIRAYVFDETGAYTLRNADVDGDGRRKEVDQDNDYAANNGTQDGCEDSDQNGNHEAANGETDNFRPSDDKILHIKLTWPGIGSDVDLHLIKPGSTINSDGDVYFGNLNPDWGIAGACGNPTLDVDCITTCTVENIRLDKLENGSYSIKVHYYSDHDQGPTSPTVSLTVQGVAYSFGPRSMSDGEIWDVATITWPSLAVAPGVVSAGTTSEKAAKQ